MAKQLPTSKNDILWAENNRINESGRMYETENLGCRSVISVFTIAKNRCSVFPIRNVAF